MNQNIHVTSRALIVINNHILLAYDPREIPNHYYELNKKFYYLPGGHLDFQEKAQDALIREIKEEMNYEAKIENFLGAMEYSWEFEGDKICCHTHEINLFFKVNIPTLLPNTTIIQKEKHVAFEWFTLEEIIDIDLRPATIKKLIPKWISSINNTDIFISEF